MFEGNTGGPMDGQTDPSAVTPTDANTSSIATDTANAPTPTPAPDHHTTDPTITATERHQREIIAAFLPRLIAEHNAKLAPTDTPLSSDLDPAAARDLFLTALRDGTISTADENDYLLRLPSQLTQFGADRLFHKIANNIREKQILAVVTGLTTTNWQDVKPDDLKHFLSRPRRGQPDYRTPVGFADLRRRFLSEIHPIASPSQFDHYIKAMNELENILYGPRFTAFRQFETLRKDALALGQDYDADLVTATDPTYGTNNTSPMLAKTLRDISLTPIDPEVGDQLLNRATVDGDPWHQASQEYRLSIPNLITAGLNPIYKILVNNQEVYLSKLFNLTSDQMAAIAFIPTTVGVKVRSYYRDKADALWRYLPDYIRGINGEGIDLFGRGFDERSVILPIILQSALNQIERHRDILDLSSTNPDFLFAGTAPAYDNRQTYRDAFMRGLLRGDFYREVSSTAMNADQPSVTDPGHRKVAPQLLSVADSFAPDFNRLIARYSVYSTFAGQLMGEGYVSRDAQFYWLFSTDYRGRSWVANIETSSLVTSTGCRQEWLSSTDITTPLYELARLADGYGDPNDTRSGNYVSMWDNYLSKVPLIAEYTQVIKQDLKN